MALQPHRFVDVAQRYISTAVSNTTPKRMSAVGRLGRMVCLDTCLNLKLVPGDFARFIKHQSTPAFLRPPLVARNDRPSLATSSSMTEVFSGTRSRPDDLRFETSHSAFSALSFLLMPCDSPI
jgi:hypothetical protein